MGRQSEPKPVLWPSIFGHGLADLVPFGVCRQRRQTSIVWPQARANSMSASTTVFELQTIRPVNTKDTFDIETQTYSARRQSDPFLLTDKLVSEDRLSLLSKRGKETKVKEFYVNQNENIENLLKTVDQHSSDAADFLSLNALKYRIAIHGSLAANIILAILQIYGATSSGSLSLFATMVDSIFDPCSNIMMLLCHRAAKRSNETKWPSGKSRLETVGNTVFCFIMMAASLILIIESIQALASHTGPVTEPMHIPSIIAVSIAFCTKLVLFLYCWPLKANGQISILWEDHRNDLLINGIGIITSVLGNKIVWWIDPAGAILVGTIIIGAWGYSAYGQLQLLIGITANSKFLQLITYVCVTHSEHILQVDTARAYYSGPKLIIEVDIVMDKYKTLLETHDVAEDLQNKLERLPNVERAYVHVDFETSHKPEHRKDI